jgi:hypothetical protein
MLAYWPPKQRRQIDPRDNSLVLSAFLSLKPLVTAFLMLENTFKKPLEGKLAPGRATDAAVEEDERTVEIVGTAADRPSVRDANKVTRGIILLWLEIFEWTGSGCAAAKSV